MTITLIILAIALIVALIFIRKLIEKIEALQNKIKYDRTKLVVARMDPYAAIAKEDINFGNFYFKKGDYITSWSKSLSPEYIKHLQEKGLAYQWGFGPCMDYIPFDSILLVEIKTLKYRKMNVNKFPANPREEQTHAFQGVATEEFTREALKLGWALVSVSFSGSRFMYLPNEKEKFQP